MAFTPLLLSFPFSVEQYATMEDGLTQGTRFIRAHRDDATFKQTPISRELLHQFINIFSSKAHELYFSTIYTHLSAWLFYHPARIRPFFSVSLNHAFLRIMSCGCTPGTDSVISTYKTCIAGLSVSQKQIIVDSGAWPVLITLLNSDRGLIANAIIGTMKFLVKGRSGEDYVRFVEDGYFQQLMTQFLPPPEHIAVEIPFIADGESRSADFTALGVTWLFYLVDSLDLILCSP
jgi:hypothetical protein